MVPRIGYVQISLRIESDAPGIVELGRSRAKSSQARQGPAFGIENLDAAVSVLANENIARAIHFYVVGKAHFTAPGSGAAECFQEPAVRRELLDPVIAGIGHEQVSFAIERQTFGPAELAWSISQPAPVRKKFRAGGIELLHPLGFAKLTDENIALPVHHGIAWHVEAAGFDACPAPFAQQLAIGREMIHAIVMRLDDDDVAVPIDGHAFRFTEIRLCHLPEPQKFSVGIEFLNARRHVHDIEIVVAIHGHRTRFGKAAETDPFAADDFDTAEETIFELRRRSVGTAGDAQNSNKDEDGMSEHVHGSAFDVHSVIFPFSIFTILVAIVSASSSTCVTINVVVPAA